MIDEVEFPTVEVSGFGSENTRGQGAGYQDCWGAGTGPGGSWLAVADGIGGGRAGAEAAQVAIGLAQVLLGSGSMTETRLHQLFDAAYVALRPWWVQERAGGTTLTVATLHSTGLWVASVGDSPAYVDFGGGFELVTEKRQSHVLKEWLGAQDRPRPELECWRWPEHQIRAVLVTSDGVDPAAITSMPPEQTAAEITTHLRSSTPLGGDDASASVAVVSRRANDLDNKGSSAWET